MPTVLSIRSPEITSRIILCSSPDALTNFLAYLKVVRSCGGVHVTDRGAYEMARGGGRHAGLLRVYQAKSTAELRRALRSYERQVERHRQKIEYPEQFVQDWDTKSLRVQQGLRRHWQDDIIRNQELADVMLGILWERGYKI